MIQNTKDLSLDFGKSWGYSCRTVIKRTAHCMSTAITRGAVRCSSLLFKGEKEFGLLMFTGASEGRAEIS
jgi:hypothetical protein